MYDKLEELINKITDKQQRDLYLELAPRFGRINVKLYNALGVQDKNGLIRLMEKQYEDIKNVYGESYLKSAIGKLHSYIDYIKNNIDKKPIYKQKIRDLSKGTHYAILTSGWVWNDCKKYAYTRLEKDSIENSLENKLKRLLE